MTRMHKFHIQKQKAIYVSLAQKTCKMYDKNFSLPLYLSIYLSNTKLHIIYIYIYIYICVCVCVCVCVCMYVFILYVYVLDFIR